ncbi:phosphoribosylformylglycinamidine synthase isoform X3 [Chelonia mydas]|uniref:phosphoribosylformylglycinamidine synthase isoform X3 n=1 Tax=Chelonia mydas TaxID=8469 RepID=UPI001CA81490|nr:phosphoribosylformylglycinamidine synthase isoform X3 [Chelonia mydas]
MGVRLGGLDMGSWAWPSTPGTWISTLSSSRNSGTTRPAWSASTWPSPTDVEEVLGSLFESIMQTQESSSPNVVMFSDNSRGGPVQRCEDWGGRIQDVQRTGPMPSPARPGAASETCTSLIPAMAVLHFYQRPGAEGVPVSLLRSAQAVLGGIRALHRELCYNVSWTGASPPSPQETQLLRWLFGCPFESGDVATESFLRPAPTDLLVEIGPRLNFSTAFSTNVVSVCRAAGLGCVDRVECSRRYLLQCARHPTPPEEAALVAVLSDRMTEQRYEEPIRSFAVATHRAPTWHVDVLGGGRTELERANQELGLAFDSWDLDFYTELFKKFGRNPTSVECFDLAQSNSEHSRHWFFKGRLLVDGKEVSESLFESIVRTQEKSNPNNVIKFSDNSSAIQGRAVCSLWPRDPSRPSRFEKRTSTRHVIFTAETHNFPTGVAPYSGAATGTGGRIRDVQCTGRGAHVIAGTAGYSFGNLHIPGYPLPWEDPALPYPRNYAQPLQVALRASDGASDYGNKFGEPVLAGFARSFGQQLPNGQRREWIKPIMFSGGIGAMEDIHVHKEPPEPGMLVVKVGGPVYRIGVGGSSASSIQAWPSTPGTWISTLSSSRNSGTTRPAWSASTWPSPTGHLLADVEEVLGSLFESIMQTQESSSPNVVMFSDNSRGGPVQRCEDWGGRIQDVQRTGPMPSPARPGAASETCTSLIPAMAVLHFYQRPGAEGVPVSLLRSAQAVLGGIRALHRELCYNVSWTGASPPSPQETQLLRWLFGCPFESGDVATESFLCPAPTDLLVEIGPRLNFSTAFSTNVVSVCRAAGLGCVDRVECSRRYLLQCARRPTPPEEAALVAVLSDRMTEQRYKEPIRSFAVATHPAPTWHVDVLGGGRTELERANQELGLAFDSWDLDFYTEVFKKFGRNPTSVECFDLAQSNSEHSRHWFFKGRLLVDGKEVSESLFESIMRTQEKSNPNNVIKFSDNSSAIQGRAVCSLWPRDPSRPSRFEKRTSTRHVIFTAETHNFPTGVAPFSGAATGTGGRIRDVQCTGRGAHVIAGTAGYSFGNLHIPGYPLPWEDPALPYPRNYAQPLQVALRASDGASDYGNKFGEPVLAGFARSFGQQLPNGQRREWIKPIMFSGGIGAMEDIHVHKEPPEPGMQVVKVGGPVYRIGVGGSSASSIQVQGDNASDLDFGAVQRGDPEMEQKMNRVLRGCVETGKANPICSLHDQGAGGNGNVLKELSDPAGAVIYASRFQLGDPTLSVLEIWGAEYQESNALLLRPTDAALLQRLGQRERCPVDVVGTITGDGRIVLVDDLEAPVTDVAPAKPSGKKTPVDLQLEWVLGKMPQKEFVLSHNSPALHRLCLPPGLSVGDALERVLRLPAVASKRYLTNKVDRSVTGLVAQQQCVGPLHTPLADVAVVALSPFETVGAATALGEQPLKGLIDPGAGARLAVGEALTNLVFARVTDLRDVKCSGNWMWAAKQAGEGAALVDACRAMCAVMGQLGVAVDGGKDSLSMAARVGTDIVMAPGTLVVSAYAVCPDIRATVTPDLKCPDGKGALLYVELCPERHRLGGSALAQCYSQLGDSCPDLENPDSLAACFRVTQQLLQESVVSAGHDVSDGGLVTCLLEMAFAGNCGLQAELVAPGLSALGVLFAEELGLVLEVPSAVAGDVCRRYEEAGVRCLPIGQTGPLGPQSMVRLRVNGQEELARPVGDLRALWEATSFQLERLQASPQCVEQEERGLAQRQGPSFTLTFDPKIEPPLLGQMARPGPRVAILREEGSNGDREMVAAFVMAGFQAWDVTMQDLYAGEVTLESFRGLVFVGGFSYADVLGSAKGWAASVTFNPRARAQFEAFHRRRDTFSLGVCNGCQLMALLGWVGGGSPTSDPPGGAVRPGVLLAPNDSGRFESRFVALAVEQSPAVMLQGMAGSTLGIWVAHGEGRMRFRSPEVLAAVTSGGLAPLRYVDDQGQPTQEYPLNPNGSPLGIAGLCSPDGRHLAMMPHPERCVLPWQWAWMPPDWRRTMEVSPWLRMFQNACEWCLEHPEGEF